MGNNYLQYSIRQEAEQYIGAMTELTGIDPRTKSRERPVVVARELVAAALLQAGFTTVGVGAVLGVTHSNVVHYRHKVKQYLQFPRAYRDELALWEAFNERMSTL